MALYVILGVVALAVAFVGGVWIGYGAGLDDAKLRGRRS